MSTATGIQFRHALSELACRNATPLPDQHVGQVECECGRWFFQISGMKRCGACEQTFTPATKPVEWWAQ